MSKSLTASKKVMQNYLSELLTETELPVRAEVQVVEVVEDKPLITRDYKDNSNLEKLLDKVEESESEPLAEKKLETIVEVIPQTTIEKVSLPNVTPDDSKEKSYRQGDFQAMFFDVAGLIIAVPLVDLGGIHKVDKVNSLMGKPDWYKGVMLLREEKINVVDTALWVMPEKYDEKLKSSLNYQYIIMLNGSSWGLMAEQLVDTVVLSQDEVKWLDSTNKRPWLAGLVKDKMCALLDVNSLIKLLDKGSCITKDS